MRNKNQIAKSNLHCFIIINLNSIDFSESAQLRNISVRLASKQMSENRHYVNREIDMIKFKVSKIGGSYFHMELVISGH